MYKRLHPWILYMRKQNRCIVLTCVTGESWIVCEWSWPTCFYILKYLRLFLTAVHRQTSGLLCSGCKINPLGNFPVSSWFWLTDASLLASGCAWWSTNVGFFLGAREDLHQHHLCLQSCRLYLAYQGSTAFDFWGVAVSQDETWSFSSWKYHWKFPANDLTAVDGTFVWFTYLGMQSLLLVNAELSSYLGSYIRVPGDRKLLPCPSLNLDVFSSKFSKDLSVWFLHGWGNFIFRVCMCLRSFTSSGSALGTTEDTSSRLRRERPERTPWKKAGGSLSAILFISSILWTYLLFLLVVFSVISAGN